MSDQYLNYHYLVNVTALQLTPLSISYCTSKLSRKSHGLLFSHTICVPRLYLVWTSTNLGLVPIIAHVVVFDHVGQPIAAVEGIVVARGFGLVVCHCVEGVRWE